MARKANTQTMTDPGACFALTNRTGRYSCVGDRIISDMGVCCNGAGLSNPAPLVYQGIVGVALDSFFAILHTQDIVAGTRSQNRRAINVGGAAYPDIA